MKKCLIRSLITLGLITTSMASFAATETNDVTVGVTIEGFKDIRICSSDSASADVKTADGCNSSQAALSALDMDGNDESPAFMMVHGSNQVAGYEVSVESENDFQLLHSSQANKVEGVDILTSSGELCNAVSAPYRLMIQNGAEIGRFKDAATDAEVCSSTSFEQRSHTFIDVAKSTASAKADGDLGAAYTATPNGGAQSLLKMRVVKRVAGEANDHLASGVFSDTLTFTISDNQ